MKYNNRKTESAPLSEIIEVFKKKYHLTEAFDIKNIKNKWDDIVGIEISDLTKQIFLKQDVLYVKVVSAPLKHQLMYNKDNIKKQLNDFLGEEKIINIVFL
ncbi:MAG: DUF721 domain-containing protein [Chitinophagaceae bacterium]|nr:DUF721 domain-containing protein [Chitinophagaceae bacterium]